MKRNPIDIDRLPQPALLAQPSLLGQGSRFGGGFGQPAKQDMTLQDLAAVIGRRKQLIIATGLVILALVTLAFVFSTRLYKSSAVIQVQKDGADALSLGTMIGSDGPGDALEANVTLQTQAQILESEALALQVVQELHLEHSPDFKSHFNPIGWVLDKLSPSGIPDSKSASLAESPARRDHIVKTFEGKLKVKPIAGTRLIDVSYLSTNPQTAAAVVNQLVTDLIDYNFSTRLGATKKASGWLAQQLTDLKEQTEQKQAAVVALQKGSGVFNLGKTEKGTEELYTPALDRLQKATAVLSDAQAATIIKGSLYQVVKDGDPELISGLAGNGMMTGASPGITGSLMLLQNLRAQEAQAKAQLDEMSQKFGPGYPKLTELNANLTSTQNSIKDETRRIAGRAKNDYAVAQTIEAKDQAVFDQEKSQAVALNGKAMQYEIVRQEADQSRNLYESLMHRMQEADLIAGLRSSNITVVNPARSMSRPSKPSLVIYAAAGILGAVILGICAGLLRDATDNRIVDIGQLELPTNLIGFLPFHKSAKKALGRGEVRDSKGLLLSAPPGPKAGDYARDMIAANEPHAVYTEALRAVRTTLMRSGNGQPPRMLLITSSVAGEGKSLMSINLAITYAQQGKKVLLVDGDLRTPTIGERLHLSASDGLSELLDEASLSKSPRPITIDLPNRTSMDVLLSGASPAYPAELIGSERMEDLINQWRTAYDFVVIDGAPLLSVTDSALLSHLVDYTMVVARHQVTDRRSIERSWSILKAQGVDNAGVVLNGIKAGSAQYNYYGHTHSVLIAKESRA